MRKSLAVPLLILATIAVVAVIVLRIQPGQTATISRHGQNVTAHTSPLFIRSTGAACRAATLQGRPVFDESFTGTTSTLDEFSVRVRAVYAPPSSTPATWPDGDWCSSMRTRIATLVSRVSSGTSFDDVLADRRATGDRMAARMETALRADGLAVDTLSARVDLPHGFERARTAHEVAARARPARPVIFLGLDGADWQLLDGYMAGGTMPNLARLVATGTSGVLLTEHPPLSPLIWTTMMTGTGPLDHRILDFTRFNPQSHDKEPITSDERAEPAIWNMLTVAGKSVAVFGLWATYAAEPVHGINVSDRLFTFLYTDSQRPAETVYPATREAWATSAVSLAEERVNAERLRQYIPSLSDEEFAALQRSQNPYADPPAALRRILVETEIYRTLGASVLAGRIPDVTIVYIQGTDTIGHVFAPFAPPKQPSISDADFARYGGVPQRYFQEIDALIGNYMQVAERNGAVLMLASDHGFFWREGRPTQISSTATATAAKWHRTEGIYALWGKGVAGSGGHTLRGGVRQVCATLLALSGMPAPSTGVTPLAGAGNPNAPLDYSKFFQRAAPPPASASSHGSDEEIAKLRALGYIGSGESARPAIVSNDTRTAGSYNNAGLLLRNEHRIDEALAAFAKAMEIDPKYASAMWNSSETLFLSNRDLDRSDSLLVGALRNGMSDAPRLVITRVLEYQRSGRAPRSLPLLDAAVDAAPGEAELRMFRGGARMERHDCRGALTDFQSALPPRPGDPLPDASAGLAQLCLGDEAAALESFRRSLAIEPNQPMIRSLVH